MTQSRPPTPTTALQFSGGRDSLACLHLSRPSWSQIVVVWLNTGAAFPEVADLMEEVKAEVPYFYEVKSDVLADIAAQGLPVDVLPIDHGPISRELIGREPKLPTMRSWVSCCMANIWQPMNAAMHGLGIKTIIRGTRKSEKYANPKLFDGMTFNGITYRFPLWDWTDADVDKFFFDNAIPLPLYYEDTGQSLDCWCCTAYLEDHFPVLEWMKSAHPERFAQVQTNLKAIDKGIAKSLTPLNRIVRG